MWWLDIKLIKNVNDFVDFEGKPIRINDGQADDTVDGGAEMEI
jgi:hypothetical protein